MGFAGEYIIELRVLQDSLQKDRDVADCGIVGVIMQARGVGEVCFRHAQFLRFPVHNGDKLIF